MICRHCGKLIEDDSIYCDGCGGEVFEEGDIPSICSNIFAQLIQVVSWIDDEFDSSSALILKLLERKSEQAPELDDPNRATKIIRRLVSDEEVVSLAKIRELNSKIETLGEARMRLVEILKLQKPLLRKMRAQMPLEK